MAYQLAREPYSMSLKYWLLARLFPAEFSPKYEGNLGRDFVNIVQETYEHDGIDISDGSYTLAPDYKDPETLTIHKGNASKYKIRVLLTVVSVLLGLPSRAFTIVETENDIQYPILSLKQLGLNMIGGWDSDPKISREKKIWQWISLPFKILLVLPIKLLTLPFKFIINAIKSITEVLPLTLAHFSARLLGAYRNTPIGGSIFPSLNRWKMHFLSALLITILLGFFKIPHLVLGSLYYAFRTIALVGRAITSPKKSMLMALNYGRELDIEFGESEAGIWFGHLASNIIGVMGALISMAITATFWILTFPLALSTISTVFPALVQALTAFTQLPAVVAVMTWFSQAPFITASLGLAHSAFTTLGLAISSAFGPAITALGAFVGLQISVGIMITATALGLIGAVVTPPLTTLSEFLSNRWNTWTHAGPITALVSLFTPKPKQSTKSDETELDSTALLEPDKAVDNTTTGQLSVSKTAADLKTNLLEHIDSADKAAQNSDKSPEYKRAYQQGFLNSPDLYENDSNLGYY